MTAHTHFHIPTSVTQTRLSGFVQSASGEVLLVSVALIALITLSCVYVW